ncbi:psbP domain-containing protein 7, chloroplastic-like [Triticum aestivum]|uniref:psbP domain-containing protein 7, chloroplastic-like n=1 Tax=Triticum aestivum TaxID=4565 RepID=UPI001D00EA9A|nr:psbP domain-containing protein 7, chloroplastic-like [Triticum aestivum]
MDTVRRHHPAMGGGCRGPTSLRCSSSPAQEFARLASVFPAAAGGWDDHGGGHGGRLWGVIRLSPELGCSLRLDVLHPICGFTRCLDSSIDSTKNGCRRRCDS